MAFEYVSSGTSNDVPVDVPHVLADSSTFKVGDMLKLDTDEALSLVGATNPVYGRLSAIVREFGPPPPKTDGAGGDFLDTYTTASDNETVLKTSGLVTTSTKARYSVPLDATAGTTTGSDIAGYRFDCTAASDTIDESTATTGSAQFVSHGIDPDNSSNVIVSIFESQTEA